MSTSEPAATAAAGRTAGMAQGRARDSARRRQRVLAVIETVSGAQAEISVSGIARAAGVDRTFLYRHRDLLARVHALEAVPAPVRSASGPAVTRASLQADLLAAGERTARLTARIRQLEQRLSAVLGESVWRESGLGDAPDLDQLRQRLTDAQQQVIDVRVQLEQRDDDLAAARAANRELMAQLNSTARR